MMSLSQLHPFDPLTPEDITLCASILRNAIPGATLRFKRIDVLEPVKGETVPYLEAERSGHALPPKPARLLFSYFHRMDTGVFHKAVVNVNGQIVYIKELPKDIQV
jgi:primary-amine oxidase